MNGLISPTLFMGVAAVVQFHQSRKQWKCSNPSSSTRTDVCEPLTASDVMDYFGCSRRTALDLLYDLVDGGSLRSKTVGSRSRVFWRPQQEAGEGDRDE